MTDNQKLLDRYVDLADRFGKRHGVALDKGSIVSTDGHRMLVVTDTRLAEEESRILMRGEHQFPENWREAGALPKTGYHVDVEAAAFHTQALVMDKVAKAARHEQVASFRALRDAPDSSRKDVEAARMNMRNLPQPYFRMRLSEYFVFLSDATERTEVTVPVIDGKVDIDQTHRLSLNSKYVVEGSRIFRKLRFRYMRIDFGKDDWSPMHLRGTSKCRSLTAHYIVMPMRP